MGWTDVRAFPSGGRVLVVDDDTELRNTLKKVIGSLGYFVHAAGSSEEADVHLNTQRYDVCLLDIELPRMTGVEFLGWALKRDPEMAVIMLSGLDAPDLALDCLRAGARTYLVKPISTQFLSMALQDAVSVRRILVERNDLAHVE
jgi:DNA-binding NtrC family response regulator